MTRTYGQQFIFFHDLNYCIVVELLVLPFKMLLIMQLTDFVGEAAQDSLQPEGTSLQYVQPPPDKSVAASAKSILALRQAPSCSFSVKVDGESSLCIAVIGATGGLAKRKTFPALFALYYSGFLLEVYCCLRDWCT